MLHRRLAAALVLLTTCGLASTVLAQLGPCVGDCNGNGVLSVDELVRGVTIASGSAALATCPQFDVSGNGAVTIDELVQAIGAALNGCQASTATPTALAATATASASPTETATVVPATATATSSRSATPSATASATPTDTTPPTATPTVTQTATATATGTVRPNVIVINLDDTRADGVDRMPVFQSRVVDEGVYFSEAYVADSSCCPSRASLFTGQYALHHGTKTVAGIIGGAHTFRESGADQQTIAVWMHDAGYTTGLFGKYLNDYSAPTEGTEGPNGTFYVPPGWDRWRAFVSPEHYGGVGGTTYQIVDELGALTTYDDHTTDAQYSTDTTATWMRDFINDAVAAGQPFFAVWTPYASHSETPGFAPVPAQRHLNMLLDLPLWRPPSWMEPDISDKPRWVSGLQPDTFNITDGVRRRAYQSLLAVDEQIGMTLDLLAELGIDEHTAVFVTSDNGSGWGDHRMIAQFKGCPYEECIKVPMAVRYPRGTAPVPATYDSPVANIDIASTVADLANVFIPSAVDGQSFLPWLRGTPPANPRHDLLLEAYRVSRNDSLVYSKQVADGDQVRLFYGIPRQPRASVLFEFDAGDGVDQDAVAVPIGENEDLTFHNLGAAIVANTTGVGYFVFGPQNSIAALDQTPEHYGVYWWVERTQIGAFYSIGGLPDYFGVRDVVNGYTYVEYETEETELYDLDADPWQLQNVALSPEYAEVRATLAARLRELLAPR